MHTLSETEQTAQIGMTELIVERLRTRLRLQDDPIPHSVMNNVLSSFKDEATKVDVMEVHTAKKNGKRV